MVSIAVGDFALEADARLVPGARGAVVCHPHPAFGGRMDTPLVIDLTEALSAAGLSTVRFNFRGLGGSGGTSTGGRSEHEDVAAAAAWLRSQGAPSVALVGYSFGALMAARALADSTSLPAEPKATPAESAVTRAEPAATRAVFAFAAVALPTTIVGDDPERVAPLERAIAAGVPSLFVAGDSDQFCETDRIASWIAGKPWARQEVLSGRGHFFDGAQARDLSARVARFVSEQP